MDVYLKIVFTTILFSLSILPSTLNADLIHPDVFNEHTYREFECNVDNHVGRAGLLAFLKSIKSITRQPGGDFFIELDQEYTSAFGNNFAIMGNVVVYKMEASIPTLKNIYLISVQNDKLNVSFISPFRLHGEISCVRSDTAFYSLSEVVNPDVFNEETYKSFHCIEDNYILRDGLVKFMKSLRSLKRQPEGEFFVQLGRDYTSTFGGAFAIMDEIVVYKRKPSNPRLKDIYQFTMNNHKLTISYISPFELRGEIFCNKSQTVLEANSNDSDLFSTATNIVDQ